MVRQILPLSALLLGSAFLLFAGGMNGLILPVRGAAEGFSDFSLGLLGTGWALGYIAGCLLMPRLVRRVGHVRSFGVMAALASVAVLASLLLISPWAWVPLRALSGFCFAGGAMIVESWLGEASEPGTRGRVFGIYTMVNLGASTAGQLLLTVGHTEGVLFFVLPAMFYALALVPTAVSTAAPRPLVSVSLDMGALWRNSPMAVVSVFLVGIANAAFGTLAAVYADRVGLAVAGIAVFSALPILAGALAQVPVGQVSDRTDRRRVLIGLALLAMAADLGFILLSPEGRTANLALGALLGAAIFSMYPVIIAHANDHARPDAYLQVSGGLLLIYGIGAIAGPLIAGAGMSRFGPQALFWVSLAAHALIAVYAAWRLTRRAPVPDALKGDFVASAPTRSTTPESLVLAATDAELASIDEAAARQQD